MGHKRSSVYNLSSHLTQDTYLDPEAHDGEHGKAAVVELLLLVVYPPGVGVIHKLRCTQEVAGL